MILYSELKSQFLDDVLHDRVAERIHEEFQRQLKRKTSKQELDSWRNSLLYMRTVLEDIEIAADCGVAIEYQIPQSSKRIDVLISGRCAEGRESLVIVELKQWSEVQTTSRDGVVRTFVGGALREVTHPSYQAWSYANLLENFNEYVDTVRVGLKPCAYLHNCRDGSQVLDARYGEYLTKAPVFLKGSALELRTFIKSHLRYGDDSMVLEQLERSRVRPSKQLADSVVSMLKGNAEFVLIDEQKLVYEAALDMARSARPDAKQVLIVHGGPGTGKSVVAINLLVELTKSGQLVQYVSKNRAPREVYQHKLKAKRAGAAMTGLFRGSGGFVDARPCAFQTLIVDEAHRLNAKSGLYGNLGENQIKEILRAASCSVFFLDEDQLVTLVDIGASAEIRAHAAAEGASIVELELPSQFRCAGSDGYIAWLDDLLGIRGTANATGLDGAFEFRVFDDPEALRDAIFQKNLAANRARLVAGYCWDWKSKKQPSAFDIELENSNFRMRWNLADDGSLWLVGENSVNEVGCIHTCQGLELDYVGVIVGPDLVMRDGEVKVDPTARSTQDRSIRGWKKLMKEQPVETQRRLDAIIRNTYRTLMTRGMKGCYVYCVDPGLTAHIRERLEG
jgi:hypothetical protein